MNCVLDRLEATVSRYKERAAVDDGSVSYTWGELLELAQRIGSALCRKHVIRKPVAVVMDKSADTLAAFLGVVYAGAFYVLINPEYPNVRIEKILATLQTDQMILDVQYEEKMRACGYQGNMVPIEAAKQTDIDSVSLDRVRAQSLDQDLLYGIFTSGSTGMPKGVIVNQRAVVDFIEQFAKTFDFSECDVIGNQAPFDFDVSVKDIYTSIFTGAKLVLIPKQMFSMPPSLLDFLCEKHVTSLTWAVSALCMVTTLRGFEYRVPSEVRRVLFSGEVMPYKHLKAWREALPAAGFVNLYGPTEIVCNCTYYRVRGDEPEDAALPIGSAFGNRLVFLLDDQNCVIRDAGIQGEICVAGTSLASGYYNNPQATEKSFVQNPENQSYPQVIYRTGDIGTYNDEGLLCFAGRRDFQVKRMGHRIELEEIQLTLDQTEGVTRSCCIYGEQEQKLVAFYVGEIDKKELRRKVKEQMPAFMLPDKFLHMDEMPMTKNGKIDRAALWNHYREEKRR